MELAGAVSRHRVGSQAVQTVFRLPGFGFEPGELELEWETDAAGLLDFFDVGVDAGGESFEDFLCIGSIAFVFSVHVAAIPQKTGADIPLHERRSKDFREAPLAGALPKFHLEKAVLRDDKALREEKIVLVLRIDVGNAPAVALDADRLLEAVHVERPVNYRQSCFGASFEARRSSLRRRLRGGGSCER